MSAWILLSLACLAPEAPEVVPSQPSVPAHAPEPAAERILGLVVAEVEEEVTARAPGQLAAFDVGLGDAVTAGQPLARIEDPGLAHTLSRARARTTSASSAFRAADVRASAAAEESASLADLGTAIARHDVDQASALAAERAEDANALGAGAAEARAELALLEDQANALVVVARTSGRVAALYKRLGENVSAGDPVLRIVSDEQIVRFAVPADVTLWPGQPIAIRTRDGNGARAEVARMAPSVDSAGMILAETGPIDAPHRNGDVCDIDLSPDS